MVGFVLAALVRRKDGDPLLRHVDVAKNQGQSALADGAKPHENQPALKSDVFLFVHFIHGCCFSAEKSSTFHEPVLPEYDGLIRSAAYRSFAAAAAVACRSRPA